MAKRDRNPEGRNQTRSDKNLADRAVSIAAVEKTAEVLSVHQIDLLSQLESQLRAARHTIVAVNRLRDKAHRVGPEPTNGQRSDMLIALSDEVTAIDQNLLVQHQTCLDQQRLIREMQARLTALKVRAPDKS